MKTIWIFLGFSALVLATGLLVQASTWLSLGPLEMMSISASAEAMYEEENGVPPADTGASNQEGNIVNKKGRGNEADASPRSPNSSTVMGMTLFNYDEDEPMWYTVNDDVMGGVSTSAVTTDDENRRLVFSGDLSLENNGGFASIRSQWSNYDLTGYDGIVLRVLGDGRTYQFRIRAEETGSEIAYAALLETEAGVWKDVYISFEEMVPVYRGVIVRRAPALDPGSIRSFGLMLADKQEGEFSIEVERLSAVVAGNRQV